MFDFCIFFYLKLLRGVRTEEAVENVYEIFKNNPHSSTRKNPFIGDETDDGYPQMSRRTLQRILKEDLHFHPYHLQMLHDLQQNDLATRISFAQSELERMESNPDRLKNYIFTDEANIDLFGSVNRQDWIMWTNENPHFYGARPLHPQKLTVWMDLGIAGVIGPYFWEKDPAFPNERGITARWMELLLNYEVIPALKQ